MKPFMQKIGIVILIALGLGLLYLGYAYHQFSKVKASQIQKLNEGSQMMVTEVGTIEYAIRGEGYPVLMIHGAGGGYDQGLLLADYLLPENCKIIAISRFGYVNTPLPEDATPDHQAALYKALLDALGIEQVNVVGVSDGGPSALKFSIFYPEYTKSLTMIAAKSQTPPEQTPVQAAVFGTIFEHDFLFWMITEHMSSQLSSVLGVSKAVQAQMTDDEKIMATEFFGSMSPISLRKAGIYNANIQFKSLLPEDYPIWEIKVPTLVVHAEDDTLQPFRYAAYTHEQIKGSQLLSFEMGGHMLFGHREEIIEAADKLFKSVE
ncbi:alpha/beta fold hydrolase [Fusibacter sp. 3D3]|uniref:alpha/beta fold hydrolase n=1 Tax=Fusibacter sp. 3D3 TaxID=1048380 RepID=UPI0008539C9B|nr:alpha/beta hydrolase [Fusibacter sp. 3D3]GAU77110.1 aromatic hydrocarbon catabolism protein [Fusibacter sp. 3D3]